MKVQPSLSCALVVVFSLGCGSEEAAPIAAHPAAPVPVPETVSRETDTEAEQEEPAQGESFEGAEAAAAPETEEGAEPRSAALSPEMLAAISDALEENGLPAVTAGRPIRMPALEVTVRDVDGRPRPSIAISDEASRARLDELIGELPRDYRRCVVRLATETLVGLRCHYRDNSAYGHEDQIIGHHFRVGSGGDVEAISLPSLFHPGVGPDDLYRRLLHNPSASNRRAVLARNGLELIDAVGDDLTEIERVSWRALGPYARADGALGPLLAEHGVLLAPVGTSMPPAPSPSVGLFAYTPTKLEAVWRGLSPELRAQVGFIDPGGATRTALVFPPGTERSTLTALAVNGVELQSAYYLEPMGRFVRARAKSAAEVRERPGRAPRVRTTLAEGDEVTAVRGFVERAASGVGRGRWAFVIVDAVTYGWAEGRLLEEAHEAAEAPHADDAAEAPADADDADDANDANDADDTDDTELPPRR